MVTKSTTTKKVKTTKTTKEKEPKLELTKKLKKEPKMKVEEPEISAAPNEIEITPEKLESNNGSNSKYYEAVGRRKSSTARVRVFTKKSTDTQPSEEKALVTVNGKSYEEYFPEQRLQIIVEAPLRKLKSLNRFKAIVKIKGGGIHGQADALKFGLSRALVLFDPNFAKKLRKAGYLTRDAREKERRKYGLKKARKAPQWAKR